MAPEREEIVVRRIIACFAPGSAASPAAIARLAREMQAELLGLFIEDAELLRFAALPLAAEIGFPSAAHRKLDPASMERALRAPAAQRSVTQAEGSAVTVDAEPVILHDLTVDRTTDGSGQATSTDE
mgnify:CR=1 FL=1